MYFNKIFGLLIFVSFTLKSFAQDSTDQKRTNAIMAAIVADDSSKLGTFVTMQCVNECFGNYSLLSEAIRNNAPKCFTFLIVKGADVNRICNDYVPPLMHAAKYGRLDMVKTLISKGADVHFTYRGAYTPADGQTPLTYAEKYKRTDVVDYLKTLH